MAATSNYPSAVQMYLKSSIHLWSWSLGSYLRPGGLHFGCIDFCRRAA